METKENGANEPARPLTAREREILDFLLSVETAGIEELRQQADHARVVPWSCGCASIDISVDQGAAPTPSAIAISPAIESQTKQKDDLELFFELLLWVDNGFLSGVEIVDYSETHGGASRVFPPASDFDPPRVR